ncbi:hypothetical protein JF541_16110 [Marinobacter hydrocarbonoclasticus]|uniref:hypothetical protein n=1 Tax=Marinobacter nauticus TaxID=2743 RepID=UPI001A8C6DE1|nr:hypothetical protein [Marinobacter nauticus]MBN8240685.1 hypothetical protein [Marinobacter nauticus]
MHPDPWHVGGQKIVVKKELGTETACNFNTLFGFRIERIWLPETSAFDHCCFSGGLPEMI